MGPTIPRRPRSSPLRLRGSGGPRLCTPRNSEALASRCTVPLFKCRQASRKAASERTRARCHVNSLAIVRCLRRVEYLLPYAELFAANARKAPEATSSRGGQAKHTAYTDFVFRSHLGCRSYSASKSWERSRRAANVGWVGGITPRARHPTHGYKGRDTGRRNGTKKNLPAWPSERFLASEPPHGTRAVLDRWLPGSDPQSTAET